MHVRQLPLLVQSNWVGRDFIFACFDRDSRNLSGLPLSIVSIKFKKFWRIASLFPDESIAARIERDYENPIQGSLKIWEQSANLACEPTIRSDIFRNSRRFLGKSRMNSECARYGNSFEIPKSDGNSGKSKNEMRTRGTLSAFSLNFLKVRR